MLPRGLLRNTTGMRLALRFSLLFAIATAVVLLALYFLISLEFRLRLESRITNIESSLVELGLSQGFDAVRTSIDENARVAQQAEIVYILQDSNGVVVAGNASGPAPFEYVKTIPWEEFKLFGTWPPREPGESVICSWIDVAGGKLLVGIGNGDIIEAREIIGGSLLVGIVISSLVGVIGGILLGWRADRSIRQIASTLDLVANGQLDERIRPAGTEGDLARVSHLVNGMLDRLQSVIVRLREVSGDIAHDLRTPISHVKHTLDFISSDGSSTEEIRVRAESASDEIQSVLATFEAILRTSEIESGIGRSRFQNVDLASAIRDVVDAFEPIAEEAGQVLASGIAAEAVLVRGDPELLRQLLANVVGNAIQHCPPGTHIDVSIEQRAGSIELCVSDSGPGIPESEWTSIFKRHHRLQKERSTPGFGVGLSLVSAIAKLHDAEINLANNEPGLRFVVRFRHPSGDEVLK